MTTKRALFAIFSLILVVNFASSQTQEPPKLEFRVNGMFNTWGQTQQDFLLGMTDYRDHYLVQVLRLNFTFSYGENIRAITRFDLGQGWWGVDNQGPTYRTGSGSALFDNKDTKFFLHVDHAYLWFNVPNISTAFSVGRFNWSVGNRLVLDNNYDGLTADIKVSDAMLKLGWAKVSEGVDGLSDQTRTARDWRGNYDARDADLFLATYTTSVGASTKLELYGMYYTDRSIEDSTAYIIDGLFYNRPRFTPQVTKLGIFGLSGTTKIDKLTFAYEVNYLTGKDEIKNPTHRGLLNTSGTGAIDPLKYDINNGDLAGYNIFVRATYTVAPAVTLGAVAGRGSGDDDPTKGNGNVNKLRTAGFFFLTELWEDSIMPDDEGITPQGLGAPGVRGYREFENTTALQVNATFKATAALTLFASYTFLTSTEPIYAWTTAGPNLALKANDIGSEVDVKADYKIYDNLTATVRGGYFMPGKGAKYLLTGTDRFSKNPWEIRTEIRFVF